MTPSQWLYNIFINMSRLFWQRLCRSKRRFATSTGSPWRRHLRRCGKILESNPRNSRALWYPSRLVKRNCFCNLFRLIILMGDRKSQVVLCLMRVASFKFQRVIGAMGFAQCISSCNNSACLSITIIFSRCFIQGIRSTLIEIKLVSFLKL